MKRPFLTLCALWLAWAAILLGFQLLVSMRMAPVRPDYAREWTHSETGKNSNRGKIYLLEPFMNRQVAWDSEYYLSIAVGGYEDPAMRLIDTHAGKINQNYAFFALYPSLMRLVAIPLSWLPGSWGQEATPIGRAALAGVIVSLLGTLGGMVALFDLARQALSNTGESDDAAGLRAVFYMLVFPSAFFLAQVYTEGLFAGLAFGALAFLRRKNYLVAGILAALSVATRSVGVALALAMGIAWLREIDFHQSLRRQITKRRIWNGLACLLPGIIFLLWYTSNAGGFFRAVESDWFGRHAFDFGRSLGGWANTLTIIAQGHPHAKIVTLMEVGSTLLAILGAFWSWKCSPELAAFCLAGLAVTVFSGDPQSMIRYVLAFPAMFLLLADWGRRPVFDRAWSLASVLFLGMNIFLFTFDMWVA